MKLNIQVVFAIARRLAAPVVCLALFSVVFSAAVMAQSGSTAPTDREIIVQLQKRIEALEAAQKKAQENAGTPNVTPPPPPMQASQPAVETPAPVVDESDSQSSEDSAPHSLGPVRFRGYSDFNYGRALFEKMPEGTEPGGGLKGSSNSMNIGDFDLFVNARISNHLSVLGELLTTSDFSNAFGAEIDRLLLTYRANDYFNISFGKFNTSLGYYPNAFHRARYFQMATGRPMMYADEDNGGILPLHGIGVTMTGKILSEGLGLHWVAEVTNGRPANSEAVPVQNFVDENQGKALTFGLYSRPARLSGFEMGMSFYRDTLHPVELDAPLRQSIVTGHVVYVGQRLEFLNEASLVRNEQKGTGFISRSTTMYSQISRRYPWFTPFARYDYQNIPNTDPIFGHYGRRNGPSIGINRRLSNFLIFKLQYGRLESRGNESIHDLQAQLAFAF